MKRKIDILNEKIETHNRPKKRSGNDDGCIFLMSETEDHVVELAGLGIGCGPCFLGSMDDAIEFVDQINKEAN